MIIHFCKQIIPFNSFVKKIFPVAMRLWSMAPDSVYDSRSRYLQANSGLEIVLKMTSLILIIASCELNQWKQSG
jgi:hypothetical protein